MSLAHRTTLTSALAIALLAAAPNALAQPEEEEAAAEATEEAEGEEGTEGTEGAEGAEEPPAEPPPSVDLGGWGIGGKEEEGKYKPRGKTGKLKEEEHEEEEAEKAEGPPNLPPPGYAYLDTSIGFGDARVVLQSTGSQLTDVTPTASFLMGVGYRIGDTWSIGARFPISTGESNGPLPPRAEGRRDPDHFKQIATGGVEISVTPAFILSQSLRLPVGLALVIPTQAGDMNADADNLGDVGTAIVNQAASSSRGYKDRALFEYKRFGIVPSVGILWDYEGFEVSAETKIEIMVATGGNDPQDRHYLPQMEKRSVIANWVTGGSFFYGFFDGMLAPGLSLWLAVGTAGDVTESQDYGGAQFVFEPFLKSDIPFTDDNQVGMNLGVGAMVPLGGHLGGANDADIIGLRIRTGLFF